MQWNGNISAMTTRSMLVRGGGGWRLWRTTLRFPPVMRHACALSHSLCLILLSIRWACSAGVLTTRHKIGKHCLWTKSAMVAAVEAVRSQTVSQWQIIWRSKGHSAESSIKQDWVWSRTGASNILAIWTRGESRQLRLQPCIFRNWLWLKAVLEVTA